MGSRSKKKSHPPAASDEGVLRFMAGDNECLRFMPDGKCYVRNELVDDNKMIYAAIRAQIVDGMLQQSQQKLLQAQQMQQQAARLLTQISATAAR